MYKSCLSQFDMENDIRKPYLLIGMVYKEKKYSMAILINLHGHKQKSRHYNEGTFSTIDKYKNTFVHINILKDFENERSCGTWKTLKIER